MDVSIIIVNWNTIKLLRECIQSVYDETTCSFEIFVVDNNSSDGSADMVRKEFPNVLLIANDDNKGFAAGNNQAMKLCKGDHILLLNPDTKVLKGAIDKLLAFLNSKSDMGAAACKLLNGDGSLQKSVGNFYSFIGTLFENRIIPKILPNSKYLAKKYVAFWDHTTPREIDWARGAVLLVRREVVEQIGLLDEQFYIYGEEIDWCQRIKNAGWKIWYTPDAEIIHYGKASSSQRNIEMFIQNYKSFYILIKKHYPWFSYFLYRIRAMTYLVLWLLKFSITFLLSGKGTKKRQSAVDGFKLYTASWRWHFSSRSKIKVSQEPAPQL